MNPAKLIAAFVTIALLTAGCLQSSPATGNSTSNPSINATPLEGQADFVPAIQAGNASELALSAQDLGFDTAEFREYSNALQALQGSQQSAEVFDNAGFRYGVGTALTKIEGNAGKRVAQEAFVFNSSEGAKAGFEALALSIAGSGENLSLLDLPKVGGFAVGFEATRPLIADASPEILVTDFILLFYKGNVMQAIDYYGLQGEVTSQQAEEIVAIAAQKTPQAVCWPDGCPQVNP